MPGDVLSADEVAEVAARVERKAENITDRRRLIATVAALRARAERAETERDAARSVVRRYHDGWIKQERADGIQAWRKTGHYPPKWDLTITPAEVAEIHAATRQPQGPE